MNDGSSFISTSIGKKEMKYKKKTKNDKINNHNSLNKDLSESNNNIIAINSTPNVNINSNNKKNERELMKNIENSNLQEIKKISNKDYLMAINYGIYISADKNKKS